MRVLFVDLEKILGTEFFVTNVASDTAESSRALNAYPVHFEHVSSHKVLVAEFFVTDRAVAST